MIVINLSYKKKIVDEYDVLVIGKYKKLNLVI